MSLMRSRPSPAMIVAALALVVALGGTAIAAPDMATRAVTKSKVKQIAKKQAKKQIKKKAPGLSVKRAETAAPSGAAGGALSGTYPDPGFEKDVVPLSLTAGWVAETGTNPTPAVWKDAYDVVHFRGSLQRTSGTSTQPFTLPAEFRPTTTKFPGLTISGGLGFLRIDASGVVTAGALTAGSDIAPFLGIEDVEFEAGT